MNAKEYLNRAYRIDQRIQSKQEQLNALNDLAEKCSIALNGMPHTSTRSSSPMADAVCKILDLERELAKDIIELIGLKSEISTTIKNVESVDYQLILEKRYLLCKSWPEIAVEMGYKMRHLYKLHDDALKAVKIPKNFSSVQ